MVSKVVRLIVFVAVTNADLLREKKNYSMAKSNVDSS
jgi:hypothetical protein